jgi:hypothetical protein
MCARKTSFSADLGEKFSSFHGDFSRIKANSRVISTRREVGTLKISHRDCQIKVEALMRILNTDFTFV